MELVVGVEAQQNRLVDGHIVFGEVLEKVSYIQIEHQDIGNARYVAMALGSKGRISWYVGEVYDVEIPRGPMAP